MTPEDRFDDLVGEFLHFRGVSPPDGNGFGSSGLRVDGRIFAMLVRGRFVAKLPKIRVDSLVAAGDGVRFDANKGTPMKEWISLDPGSRVEWSSLAHEAMEFVGAKVAR